MRLTKKRIYLLAYFIFARNLPQSNHLKIAMVIRRWFAKKIMLSVGNDVNIERGAVFKEECSIGDRSGIGVRCELNGPVRIGKYVNMGPEVVFYTRNHSTKRTDILMQDQRFDPYEPISVGDDVWIGRRAIILPGVTIGNGSVIGAGAVVTKDVEPYSVVVGNPGRVIKNRMNHD